MIIRPKRSRALLAFLVVGPIGWMMACAAGGGSQRTLSPIRFESGIDRMAFEFRPAKDSVLVIDREGRLIVRIEIETGRLLIAESPESAVIAISPLPAGKHRGYRMTDESKGSLRSELRIEKDGDLRLLQPDDTVAYRLKRRAYGFKLVDGEGEAILRVRLSGDGKLSIRDANNLTYLKTRDPIPVEAAALLAIPGLSFAEATGFAVAAWIWPEGRL